MAEVSYRAQAVWDGERLLADHVVVVRGGVIQAVRPAVSRDEPAMPGMLLPALLNAHTHLELSHVGLVPGGDGFLSWVGGLFRAGGGDRVVSARAAAHELHRLGVGAICDVTNVGDSHEWMLDAGLLGVSATEVLTRDHGALPAAVDRAGADMLPGPIGRRVTPNAPLSTAEALLAVAGRPGPVVGTVHVSEDPAERAFLEDGGGPLPDWLDAIGRQWRPWDPPGVSGVGLLERAGALGEHMLLVHGVDLDPADRARIRRSGATLALCPRSNQHIGGRLPDVPALVAEGIPLVVGTDSLASCPDLDVLADCAVLYNTWPELGAARWLAAVTSVAADALRLPLGRLRPGASPGLLYTEAGSIEDLLMQRPPREWLTGLEVASFSRSEIP